MYVFILYAIIIICFSLGSKCVQATLCQSCANRLRMGGGVEKRTQRLESAEVRCIIYTHIFYYIITTYYYLF